MKIKTIAIFISTLLIPLTSFAADKKIICETPDGMRLDYFVFNRLDVENNKFLASRDRMSKANIAIIFHDKSKDVTFYIQTDKNSKPSEYKNMKIIYQNLQQITFDGMFNRAPIMATYYPLYDILVYSQQSVWPGQNYKGARAVFFHAKCHDVE